MLMHRFYNFTLRCSSAALYKRSYSGCTTQSILSVLIVFNFAFLKYIIIIALHLTVRARYHLDLLRWGCEEEDMRIYREVELIPFGLNILTASIQ